MTKQLDKLAGKNNIHTLLIGASNTQDGEAFFSTGANGNKFWGTLSKVNNSFDGSEETSKLISKGVFICDISADEEEEMKNDKKIKSTLLQLGFANIDELIKTQPNIETIAFIGQQAAKWFYIHFINKIQIQDDEHTYKENLFENGKQKWVFNQKVTCFILKNIEKGRGNEAKEWIEFWNRAFK